jgi:CRP-like cAMP-binding protein
VDAALSIIEKTMALLESPYFKGLTTEEAARVAARTSELYFEEGDDVPYGEGSYLVLEGAVDLLLEDYVAHVVARGDGFGLGSVLGVKELGRFSGRARAGTHCLFMTREDFLEVLNEHPEVTVALLKQMFRDNVELHQEIVRLGGHPPGLGPAVGTPGPDGEPA